MKRLPMSALATVAWNSFDGNFTAKIDFPIEHFMLPLLMAHSRESETFIDFREKISCFIGPHK